MPLGRFIVDLSPRARALQRSAQAKPERAHLITWRKGEEPAFPGGSQPRLVGQRGDPETKAIYLAKSSESSAEVRLVEVSGSLGGAGEILPFRFAPRNDLGVPYASVVVLLSFEDWARLERGELSLPAGWGSAGELQKIA